MFIPSSLYYFTMLSLFCKIFEGAVDLDRAAFGPGHGMAIVLGSVNCLGNEIFLTSCNITLPNGDTHFEDAGVRCKPSGLCLKIF